jgi:hypothetical protein
MYFPINTFSRNDLKNKEFLKGYIYEWYCYNFIKEKYKSISIVEAKNSNIEENSYNYFRYTKNGSIIYYVGNNIISEFDILGIENKNIYLWEVTRGNQIYAKKNINRKINVLKLAFQNYNINMSFIVPRDDQILNKYDKIILSEPDYNDYLNSNKLFFSNKNYNCISLKDFVKKTCNNSLISEIIFLSKKYFKTKVFEAHVYYKDTITKLFEIDNIKNDEFYCYNIPAKKTEIIKYVDCNYYIDNKELTSLDISIIEELKRIT